MSLRLIILSLVALAFVSLGAAVYKYRGDAIEAQARAARIQVHLDLAVEVNVKNQKAIAELEKQAEAEAKLQAELQDELNAANASTLALAQRLSTLKDTSPDVKSFLDQPVPADLRQLYDH